MATIAIGDVHGWHEPLVDLLARLAPELGAADTVVFLGDYVDRGPDTKDCVEAILRFRDETPATVIALQGNHEEWMLRSRDDPRRHSWLFGMGGLETIRSYSFEVAAEIEAVAERTGPDLLTERRPLPYDLFFDTMPAEHLAFFERLVPFHEDEHLIAVHAGLDPGVPLAEQSTRTLFWGTDAFPSAYRGEKPVAYGHWNNAVLDEHDWPSPRIEGATFGLDTIAHGVLTAIRFPDRQVFQSERFG